MWYFRTVYIAEDTWTLHGTCYAQSSKADTVSWPHFIETGPALLFRYDILILEMLTSVDPALDHSFCLCVSVMNYKTPHSSHITVKIFSADLWNKWYLPSMWNIDRAKSELTFKLVCYSQNMSKQAHLWRSPEPCSACSPYGAHAAASVSSSHSLCRAVVRRCNSPLTKHQFLIDTVRSFVPRQDKDQHSPWQTLLTWHGYIY